MLAGFNGYCYPTMGVVNCGILPAQHLPLNDLLEDDRNRRHVVDDDEASPIGNLLGANSLGIAIFHGDEGARSATRYRISTLQSLRHDCRRRLQIVRSEFPQTVRHHNVGSYPRVVYPNSVVWKVMTRRRLPLWRIRSG
jgi:hypothetical protein